VICLVVLMYVRFPLSLRNIEDLLFERGIDISYETVRFNQERHLIDRQNYKERRSEAFSEWRTVMA
jgi:putative transposase